MRIGTSDRRNLLLELSLFQHHLSPLHLIALLLLPCLVSLLLILGRKRASPAGETDFSGPSSQSAPLALRLCWWLMAFGGLIALLFAVGAIFLAPSTAGWTSCLSLLVGVIAISRGAVGETIGLSRAAGLQAVNILSCDVFNLLFAAIECLLLRQPRVKQFLQQSVSDSQTAA